MNSGSRTNQKKNQETPVNQLGDSTTYQTVQRKVDMNQCLLMHLKTKRAATNHSVERMKIKEAKYKLKK